MGVEDACEIDDVRKTNPALEYSVDVYKEAYLVYKCLVFILEVIPLYTIDHR